MKRGIRTDLACEAQLLRGEDAAELPGLLARRETRHGLPVEVVEIRSQQASDALCKPQGRYVTVQLDALRRREEDAFDRACRVLSEELRQQLALKPQQPVLVAGLGNPDITPDAVGPLAARQVLVTRHLKQQLPGDFAAFRPVSVFCAGVLGSTGMESARLTAAAAGLAQPAAVIAVDALAAWETDRLCRSVQVCDAGIVPGSGVGNARQALDRATLGVPVVAVGVPTVVDARTLCGGACAAGEGFFVTPRDIDARVRDAAKLVGYAINLALHDGLTPGDVDMLLS